MIYLIVGVPAFVLGFLTCLVTLHCLFRERKPKGKTLWGEVAKGGGE